MFKMYLYLSFIATFFTQSVLAWHFDEHSTVGRKAYKQACRNMLEFAGNDQKTVLSSWLCKSGYELNLAADAYGRMTALSGDHLKNPEEFHSQDGEIAAGSGVVYIDLASRNATHFWPVVKKMWTNYHLKALKIANELHHKLYSDKGLKQRSEFSAIEIIEVDLLIKQMLSYSAFADHFLQDSFSIGHSGFSRASTSAELSIGFHDKYNHDGALLANYKYGSWMAYGDGKLLAEENIQNLKYLIIENTQSIENIFSEVLGIKRNMMVAFPTHTSNRFEQSMFRFQSNTVTCHGLETKVGDLFGYGYGKSLDISRFENTEYRSDFWSLEKTPIECLMPIDVNGPMPIRRLLSLDLGINSTITQNQKDVYGGWEAALATDSLFDWKYTGMGLSLNYKQVNNKGNLYAINFLLTSPYEYGDMGTVRINAGYGQYDLDSGNTREGLLLGFNYLLPLPEVSNTSIFLGAEYYCTESSHLRCNNELSELTFRLGVSFALKTIGGGYNKHKLFD